jgi:hypothetical protein
MSSRIQDEGMLNEALRQRRFSDVVLGAWVLVESHMNSIFRLALGITDPKDKRAIIVENYKLQFGDKLRFANDLGALTEDEYEKLSEFNSYRNALFHAKRGQVLWFFRMNEVEKDKVMTAAWEAVNASMGAILRLIRPQYSLQRTHWKLEK